MVDITAMHAAIGAVGDGLIVAGDFTLRVTKQVTPRRLGIAYSLPGIGMVIGWGILDKTSPLLIAFIAILLGSVAFWIASTMQRDYWGRS
jgi:hypothetical protein